MSGVHCCDRGIQNGCPGTCDYCGFSFCPEAASDDRCDLKEFHMPDSSLKPMTRMELVCLLEQRLGRIIVKRYEHDRGSTYLSGADKIDLDIWQDVYTRWISHLTHVSTLNPDLMSKAALVAHCKRCIGERKSARSWGNHEASRQTTVYRETYEELLSLVEAMIEEDSSV